MNILPFLFSFLFFFTSCTHAPASDPSASAADASEPTSLAIESRVELLPKDSFQAQYTSIICEDEENIYFLLRDSNEIAVVQKAPWSAELIPLENHGYIQSFCFVPQWELLVVSTAEGKILACRLDGTCLWETELGPTAIVGNQNRCVALLNGTLYNIDESGKVSILFEIGVPDQDHFDSVSSVHDNGITVFRVPNTFSSDSDPIIGTYYFYDWTGECVSQKSYGTWEQVCYLYQENDPLPEHAFGWLMDEPDEEPFEIGLWTSSPEGYLEEIDTFLVPSVYDRDHFQLNYAYSTGEHSFLFASVPQKQVLFVLDSELTVQEIYEWQQDEPSTILWGRVTEEEITLLNGISGESPYQQAEVSGLRCDAAAIP